MTLEGEVNKDTPIIFSEELLQKIGLEFRTRAGRWFLYGLGSELYLFERRRANNDYLYILREELRDEGEK